MTISQLIAELQAMLAAHGDLEVAHECDWNGPQGRWDTYYVDKVKFEPEYSDPDGFPDHEPPHVLLTGDDTPVRDDDDPEGDF